MRGAKRGYTRKFRRMVRAKCKNSDESDEDYMVGNEEVDESEEEYSLNFDDDESEEILDEFEEEEEVFVEKKVKKARMPRVENSDLVRGRKKNGLLKPKKKRTALYRDEVDDDDDDADYDFEDEKLNKVAKRRKRKRVSYREEDEEYDGTYDDFTDTKVNKVVKPRKKKRVFYREEDDDYDGMDEEFDDVKVNKVVKPRGRKGVSYKEEDEDFCVKNDSDNDGKLNKVSRPRKKTGVSYKEENDDYEGIDEDDDEEFAPEEIDGVDDDDEEFTPEEIDDEDELPVMTKKKRVGRPQLQKTGITDMKVNKVVKPRNKKRVFYREEDDDYDGMDEEFDEVKVNKVVKPREKKGVSYKEEDEDFCVKNDNNNDGKINKVSRPRKKNGVSYKEENDDFEGIDEDDDEEFTPEEIDGVDNDDEEFTPEEIDDEDELPAMTKKKRVGRPLLQKMGITKGLKRKRSSKPLKKTTRKKPRNNHRSRRKRKTTNGVKFLDPKPIVGKKRKEVNGCGRKRRSSFDSDSDFVSSGSSDYEFTISEEEREQIREANEFCKKFITSSRTFSNNLEEEKDTRAQRKHPAGKGKEKVEDLKVEVGNQICGICLTEEGKRTVRGTLSCCSHYFCFACIMEWSKVESRCPLCKQRFVTISKPTRSNTGFSLRTEVIQIPERDQVYQPSEEELQSFLDPYDGVICTECREGGDDALMLLCDLCDSPAHTYCVGLGHEVPEGDWYCEGCRPTALASSNLQVSNPEPDSRTNIDVSVGLSPVSNSRETFDLNEMYVPDTPLTRETSQLTSPRPSVGDAQLPSLASGSGALTVRERRRIQRQIHQLLNNRRRQMDQRTSESRATIFGNNLFGSQVARSRELSSQHAVTPESMRSNNSFFHESLHNNITPLLGNHYCSSSRLDYMGGHPCQNQPSTSTNRSSSGILPNGFSGFSTVNGLGSDLQQLQPCSSRSHISSDASMSSFNIEKEQVLSMVKSRLKSLSRDVELGYNTFKEIARCSTHTVLAACGVEHRKSEVYPVQTPLICNHIDRVGDGQIGPAQGHCSCCFDLFVRNVVKEIMNTRIAMLSKN